MIGLLGHPAAMRAVMPAEAWFVLSTLLGADRLRAAGHRRRCDDGGGRAAGGRSTGGAVPEEERRLGQITMQTLGRVAIIGGGVLVSIANVILFRGAGSMTTAQKAATYLQVYEWALIIPVISVLGVVARQRLEAPRRPGAWRPAGSAAAEIRALLDSHVAAPRSELVDPGRRARVRGVQYLAGIERRAVGTKRSSSAAR